MIRTGLVSVTFRNHPPQDIVALVSQAGLHGIEWGGDVHVPHGDVAVARAVRRMTEDAGLRVLAYGSYFRCRPDEVCEPVIESALALGAPLIRIWAGNLAAAQVDKSVRNGVVEQSRRMVQLAAHANMRVAYEFHANTLTDTAESTLALLNDVPDMHTFWQPPHDLDEQDRLRGLRGLLPWLTNVHVFHWRMPDRARLPLSDDEALWRERLRVAAEAGRHIAALLEFVRDDDPEQFLRDAAALRRVVNVVSGSNK